LWRARKPNCLALSRLLSSMCLCTIFRITFSNSLHVVNKRLIECEFWWNFGSLTGFGNVINFASSQDFGKWDWRSSNYLSLYSLGTDPIENTFSSNPSIVASCVCCCSNVYISRSLATTLSSGSTVPVFQLPYHSILRKIIKLVSAITTTYIWPWLAPDTYIRFAGVGGGGQGKEVKGDWNYIF
jgi:hypothetical protein